MQKIKWSDIVLGFYCFGCLIITLLALFSHNGLTLALIYAGFTFLCFAVLVVVTWLRKIKKSTNVKDAM